MVGTVGGRTGERQVSSLPYASVNWNSQTKNPLNLFSMAASPWPQRAGRNSLAATPWPEQADQLAQRID